MHCTLLWGAPLSPCGTFDSSVSLYCTLLYDTVLYCTLLWCAVLYPTALRGSLQPMSKFVSSGALYCNLLYCTVLHYCSSMLYIIALWSSQPHATPKYQISWESVLWLQAFKEFPGIQRVNWLIMLIALIAQSATFGNQARFPLLSLEMIF